MSCPRQDQAEFPERSISNRHPEHKQPLWLLRPGPTPGSRQPISHVGRLRLKAQRGSQPGGLSSSPAAGGRPGVVWGSGQGPGQAGLGDLAPVSALPPAGRVGQPGFLIWKVGP